MSPQNTDVQHDSVSRRELLRLTATASAALTLTGLVGCAAGNTSYTNSNRLPSADFPGGRPIDRTGRPTEQTVYPTQEAPATTRPTSAVAAIGAMPRSRWTSVAPINGRVNPMNGINRLTMHHEGSLPFTATSQTATAQRIQQVRAAHVNDRNWGDIGYHFIVDRTGTIWEARPIQYQGAHVSQNNENNLGIMCLGNFEQQQPTQAQLSALAGAVQRLVALYRIPHDRVYTHRELKPTACPGRHLQPQIEGIRSRYL